VQVVEALAALDTEPAGQVMQVVASASPAARMEPAKQGEQAAVPSKAAK
jgi:hypothetical protein